MKPESGYNIVRFSVCERMFHNVVMVTYFLLLLTGMVIIGYNFQSERNSLREIFVLAHKTTGVIFLGGTLLIALCGERAVWMENVRLLFIFTLRDIEWLVKKPVSILFRGVELPPADKFNSSQKVWSAIAFIGSVTLAVSGIYLWINRLSILALLIHTFIALGMILPLLGHMYMAIINRETRAGIGSIVNGKVDLRWAESHYPVWVERKRRERLQGKSRKKTALKKQGKRTLGLYDIQEKR